MNTDSFLKLSDKEVLKIAHELRLGYAMKRTLRYATKRDLTVHSESDAEHVFGLLYLAQYFLPLEDSAGKLDRAKVYEIILYHDFGEILHGDVPYHLKTQANIDQELKDAEVVFASLPSPIGVPARERWAEYEAHQTGEAQFVYALDKIEPLFELLDPVTEKTLKNLKFSYKAHMGKKVTATEHFPVMRRFVDIISKDMLDRDLFWPDEA